MKKAAIGLLCSLVLMICFCSCAFGIEVNRGSLLLYPGQSFRLESDPGVSFQSSNKKVAVVSSSGVVTAKKKGSAQITITDSMGRKLDVPVTIKNAPDIRLERQVIRLNVGETCELRPDAALAADATVPDCKWKYKSSKKSVVSVTSEGLITAMKRGEAQITVSDNLGRKTKLSVIVSNPGAVHRALLVGNAKYPGTGRNRPCAVNACSALAQVLSGSAEHYQITREKDLKGNEFRTAIQNAFRDADEDDVSLFFYAGHGTTKGLKGAGNRIFSYDKLFKALNAVPGKVILILDTCHSGMVLTSGSEAAERGTADAVNGMVIDLFSAGGSITDYWSTPADSQAMSSGRFRTEKFVVLTACTAQEGSDNLRLSNVYINAFTYALCLGAGWDANKKGNCTPAADYNGDHLITLSEAQSYSSATAMRLLRTPYQNAQAWPAKSNFPLFTIP